LVINVLPLIGFVPIGINKIFHAKGELLVAKVAGELRLPYSLSIAGSTAIEDVAASNDEGARLPSAVKVEGGDDEPIRFFQLYMSHDDELIVSLLTRAHESGFTACTLTTDTWQLGWRHDDIEAGNYAFCRGIGADMGLTDSVCRVLGLGPGKGNVGCEN
jgi:isopentenyl diphosphate isomerase/L-lactate dehydrogenase-like FMN-dependent dehydrogenase